MRACVILVQGLFIASTLSITIIEASEKDFAGMQKQLEAAKARLENIARLPPILEGPEEPEEIAPSISPQPFSPSAEKGQSDAGSLEPISTSKKPSPTPKSFSISLTYQQPSNTSSNSGTGLPVEIGFHISAAELARLTRQITQSTRESIAGLQQNNAANRGYLSPKNNYTCWNTLIQCVHYCIGTKV
jgi:hypothetical protein